MSIFSKIKGRISKTRIKARAIAAGVLVATASVATLATIHSASAITVTTNKTDCDANAVVWCGAKDPTTLDTIYHKTGGDGHNTSASIQWIYSSVGISGSEIDSLKTTSVNGYVTRTGEVHATIGGKDVVVATGAVTGGRTLLLDSNGKPRAGQTKHVSPDGKTTFYSRKPDVSFASGVEALSAMVSMKNGIFQFAIMNSCGNPITATPKKPNYSITKQVSAGGSYADSVTVKSGSAVKYQIVVKSTGDIPVNNVLVRDALPAKDLTVDKASLRQDGKTVSSAEISQFFGTGYTIPTIKNGSSITFTFSATKAGNADFNADNCAPETLNNTAFISTTGLSGQNDTAKVNTTCVAPALACVSLKTAAIGAADPVTGNQDYTFTATASATRVTIASYTFDYGDGSKADVVKTNKETANSPKHTYAPGTRTATVTVAGTDSAKKAFSAKCTFKVTVNQPKSGTISCTGLTATAGKQDAATGATPYSFKAAGAVVGNAQITKYVLTPDTNNASATKDMTVAGDGKTANIDFTYGVGNFTAKVTVSGKDLVTGKAITAPDNKACTMPITVKALPKPAYSILKQVSTSANGPFSDNVTVASGSTVFYKIEVKSTGDAPVTNVMVNDSHPSDIKYADSTLKQDGQSADATAFFGKGITIASIANGSSVTFTYSAVAGLTSNTDPSCVAKTLDNTGHITTTTTGLSDQNSSAHVNTTCTPPVPGTLVCSALTTNPGDTDSVGNQSYTFTGQAAVNNATIKTYAFTVVDNSGKTVASIPVNSGDAKVTTDAKSFALGKYTVTLVVTGTDNSGKTITSSATPDCAKQFTVPTPECKPGVEQGNTACFTYTCNTFTLNVNNDTRTVTVTSFNATSTNPVATLSKVMIDWGDGATSTPDNVVGTQHAFTASSSTVTATAQFAIPGSTALVNSTACSQPVSFTTTPPPVLPNTGAGNVVGIFVGTVVAATIGFRLYTLRKLRQY